MPPSADAETVGSADRKDRLTHAPLLTGAVNETSETVQARIHAVAKVLSAINANPLRKDDAA